MITKVAGAVEIYLPELKAFWCNIIAADKLMQLGRDEFQMVVALMGVKQLDQESSSGIRWPCGFDSK